MNRCPINHEAVKQDAAAWSALPWGGLQPDVDGFLELRHCAHCASTLALEFVDAPHPLDAFPIPEAA